MADEIDEQIEELDKQLKGMGVDSKDYGYPEAPKKDSIFKFFRDILNLKDSSKAANLSTAEIGNLALSVRKYQDIALYADSEGLDKVANYLLAKSQIVLATSLSKKGFLAQLFVTQIKKEQKLSKPGQKKKGWFSKPKEEGEE